MSELPAKSFQALKDSPAGSTSQTNEANLLSLITLSQLLEDEGAASDAIKGMAKEETRYLVQAMKILTDNRPGVPGMASQKLQDRFGRDMAGAVKLAELLKSQGDQKEVELLLNPFIMDTLRSKDTPRQQRGGFTTSQLRPGDRGTSNASGRSGWGQDAAQPDPAF